MARRGDNPDNEPVFGNVDPQNEYEETRREVFHAPFVSFMSPEDLEEAQEASGALSIILAKRRTDMRSGNQVRTNRAYIDGTDDQINKAVAKMWEILERTHIVENFDIPGIQTLSTLKQKWPTYQDDLQWASKGKVSITPVELDDQKSKKRKLKIKISGHPYLVGLAINRIEDMLSTMHSTDIDRFSRLTVDSMLHKVQNKVDGLSLNKPDKNSLVVKPRGRAARDGKDLIRNEIRSILFSNGEEIHLNGVSMLSESDLNEAAYESSICETTPEVQSCRTTIERGKRADYVTIKGMKERVDAAKRILGEMLPSFDLPDSSDLTTDEVSSVLEIAAEKTNTSIQRIPKSFISSKNSPEKVQIYPAGVKARQAKRLINDYIEKLRLHRDSEKVTTLY
eukprot:987786_1